MEMRRDAYKMNGEMHPLLYVDGRNLEPLNFLPC